MTATDEAQTELLTGDPRLDPSGPRAAKRLRDALAVELAEYGEVTRVGGRGQGILPAVVGDVRAKVEGDRWPWYVVDRPGPAAAALLVRGVAANEVNARRAVREWHVEAEAWRFLLEVDAAARARSYGHVVLVLDDRSALTLRAMREGREYEVTRLGRSRHVAVRQGAGAPMGEVLG